MAAPELTADLVGEFLLRLPPDEPASLVRASLVCKPWRRDLSDPTFPRRYRAFHRDPPLLGFFLNRFRSQPRFVPITSPSPIPQPALDYGDCFALDCRHGRVLLAISGATQNLVVWDPITGDRQGLPEPPIPFDTYSTAAVLCAVRGCDHLDCHSGPFLVVAVIWDTTVMDLLAYVYSSEDGAWNASAHLGLAYSPTRAPSVLVRDDIYFTVIPYYRFLRYSLGGNSLSTIKPPIEHETEDVVLMPLENGSLGLAGILRSKLFLWSRDVERWIQFRVIELEKLTTVMPFDKAQVLGSAEGLGIIFVVTDSSTIELKSSRVKMVGERGDYFATLPFMSFYTPRYLEECLCIYSHMKDIHDVGSKSYIKKLMKRFSIKCAPLRVRFAAPKPKFAGLMERWLNGMLLSFPKITRNTASVIEPSIFHSCEKRLKDVQGRVDVLSVPEHAEGGSSVDQHGNAKESQTMPAKESGVNCCSNK
ncbi:hypothetical protein EJB05_14245 [Eragrostis curvula]|uniref:F-box domain-containing protein n=1 Tax=Eragrostis curvula TaxID=38414 RepID=A0A5J9VX15_9POAL|nr:hypothetical protein EJB05_14245 [Eragrostis curvula]